MARSILIAAAAAAFGLVSLPAAATTPDDVQSFVRRAVEHVKAAGREQAFADFSRTDGKFIEGELYIYCNAADGTILAHGGNPALVGRNLLNVRDPDGRTPNADLVRVGLTEGSGWVEFRWPNPVSKKVEPKAAWVVRVDEGTVCGSGYYKN